MKFQKAVKILTFFLSVIATNSYANNHYSDQISCKNWKSSVKQGDFGRFLNDPLFKAQFKKVEQSRVDTNFEYITYKPVQPVKIFGQTVKEITYYIENQHPRVSTLLNGKLISTLNIAKNDLKIDDWQPQRFEVDEENGQIGLGMTYHAVSFNENKQPGYDASFTYYDDTLVFECSPSQDGG